MAALRRTLPSLLLATAVLAPSPVAAAEEPALLDRIERGEIDPSFVITHRTPLEQAPEMFETFKHKREDCVKVVLSA